VISKQYQVLLSNQRVVSVCLWFMITKKNIMLVWLRILERRDFVSGQMNFLTTRTGRRNW